MRTRPSYFSARLSHTIFKSHWIQTPGPQRGRKPQSSTPTILINVHPTVAYVFAASDFSAITSCSSSPCSSSCPASYPTLPPTQPLSLAWCPVYKAASSHWLHNMLRLANMYLLLLLLLILLLLLLLLACPGASRISPPWRPGYLDDQQLRQERWPPLYPSLS